MRSRGFAVVLFLALFVASYGATASAQTHQNAKYNRASASVLLAKETGSEEQFRDRVQRLQEQVKQAQRAGSYQGIFQSLTQLGLVYRHWGRHDAALESLNEALKLARKVSDPMAEASALINLALTYADKGQYEEAITRFELALSICKRIDSPSGSAMVLHNLGTVYNTWANYDKAAQCYEKSLAIRRQLNDQRWEGLTLNALGQIYYHQAKLDEALGKFEEASAVLGRFSETPGISPREQKEIKFGQAYAKRSVGSINADRGRFDKAIQAFREAGDIAKSINEGKGVADSLNCTGLAYAQLGRYKDSQQCYEQALQILRAHSDEKAAGQVVGNLGILYAATGRYDKALECFKKNEELCDRFRDPRGKSGALLSLGNVHADQGRYQEAMKCFTQSQQVCHGINDPKGEASALNNLALVHQDTGEYVTAAEMLNQCKSIYQGLGMEPDIANVLLSLGAIHSHRGQHKEALACFNEGLSAFKKTGRPLERPEKLIADTLLDMGNLSEAETCLMAMKDKPWTSLGRLYLLQSHFDKARERYIQGMTFNEKTRNVKGLFTAYTGLGLAYEGMKDYPRAAEYFRKAMDVSEDLRSGVERGERRKFYDVKTGGFLRTVPYEGLARVNLHMHKPDAAFKCSEETKARAFADSLSQQFTEEAPDVPQDIRKTGIQIKQERDALKQRLSDAFERENREAITSLEPKVREMDSRLQSHIKMLRRAYPLFAATMYPEPMDLSDTAIRDGEWVLAFDVTDTSVIVYLTHGTKLLKAIRKDMPRTELQKLVGAVRRPFDEVKEDNFAEKLKAFDFSSARRLSQCLLNDMLNDLPAQAPVTVIPDECLGTLPFEMLVLNAGGAIKVDEDKVYVSGAEFFAERNPISYYQSVTALTLARTRGKQKNLGKKTLVMDDPIFGLQDPRCQKMAKHEEQDLLGAVPARLLAAITREHEGLTFSRLAGTAELGKYLQKLDPGNTVRWTAANASKSALLSSPLTSYRSIVFATHGYYANDLAQIQEPVLVLTLADQRREIDGFLRMSDVMGLKLNADIVALTACQSGLGYTISGEGTMGMGRAFQYAGASSVLMSLWSVHERASVLLARSFFKSLKEGKSKRESLRLARSEIREKGYDHPFFWAAFILAGEAQ